jgi:hypothetical protein
MIILFQVQQAFFEYFSNDMSPNEAMQFHETSLLASDDSYIVLADSSKNPCARQVYYLYDKWRSDNLGPMIDPFDKLQEKMSLYTESGNLFPFLFIHIALVINLVQIYIC